MSSEGALGDLVMIRQGFKVAAQRFTALPRFTDEQLRRLAGSMEWREFGGGDTLINQGDASDDCFYVLKHGKCSVMVDGRNVGTILPGASFGEVSLTLPGQARTASIVSAEASGLWKLTAKVYQREMAAKAEAARLEAEEEAIVLASPTGGWRARRAAQTPTPRQSCGAAQSLAQYERNLARDSSDSPPRRRPSPSSDDTRGRPSDNDGEMCVFVLFFTVFLLFFY